MSNIRSLKVEARERVGKGASRAARRAGLIPGVIYGDKKSPTTISIEQRALVKELGRGGFLTSLYELEFDGKKEQALPRDIQFHPVTEIPEHVDFLRISADTEVVIDVPAQFVGHEESPGLKRGGVLNIVRHDIELYCPATAIPERVIINLAGLEIGDSVHASMIELSQGVSLTITDRDFTIATIAASTAAVEEAAAEAEEAEEELEIEEGEAEEGEAEETAEDAEED